MGKVVYSRVMYNTQELQQAAKSQAKRCLFVFYLYTKFDTDEAEVEGNHFRRG